MIAVDQLLLVGIEQDRLSVVVRGLAVVGAAVLGGFGTGAIVQGIAKLMSGTRVPTVPLQLIRVLAALATGWIVFLVIAGHGGSGLGGNGGDGLLPGGGAGSASSSESKSKESSRSYASSAPRYDPEATSIDVDVLETALVEKKLGHQGVEKRKFFRVEGSPELLSRAELEKELIRLRSQMPKLDHVNLRRQGDASSSSSPLITGLVQWGKDEWDDKKPLTFDTSRLDAP
jgi:hypothetical protein